MLPNAIDAHKGAAKQEISHENPAHPLLDAFMDKGTQAVRNVDMHRDVVEPFLVGSVGPVQIAFNDLSRLTGYKLGKLEIVDEAAEKNLRSSDDWFAQSLSIDASCSYVPPIPALHELQLKCN